MSEIKRQPPRRKEEMAGLYKRKRHTGHQDDPLYMIYEEMDRCEEVFWSRNCLNPDGTRSNRKRHRPPEETKEGLEWRIKTDRARRRRQEG